MKHGSRSLASGKVRKSPDGTTRNILGDTIFRESIMISNIPRLVPGWTKPIVVARHALGDQCEATDLVVDSPGRLTVTFTPANGGEPIEHVVYDILARGLLRFSTMWTHRFRGSPARASTTDRCATNPMYLSSKNTILKAYDWRFKGIFAQIHETEYRAGFEAGGLTYEHRLVDDMMANTMKCMATTCGLVKTTTETCSPIPLPRVSARRG